MGKDYRHLQDNRTFDNYMKNVISYSTKENKDFDLFIEILKELNFQIKDIKYIGSEKKNKDIVFLPPEEVKDTPDFQLNINGMNIHLEIKNSEKDLCEFHLKKFQVDNYTKYPNTFILMIMNFNNNEPHFTILKPEDVIKSKFVQFAHWGYKEVYCLNKNEYKWFKFIKFVSDELKDYIQTSIKLNQEVKMAEQDSKNWLDDEAKQFTNNTTYEELPSLRLQPNVIAELTIDFSKPFQEWRGEQNGKTITKKIIPVTLAGNRMNWWLNVKNPVYKDVIQAGRNGQKVFKILQTGSQANTKYVIVK